MTREPRGVTEKEVNNPMTLNIRFDRYEINEELLARLTEDQRAMFAVLCLAMSEIDAMKKVLMLGSSTPNGDEDLDAALISQKLVFMRIIGMKIYEVFWTVNLSGKENKSQDAELKNFRNEHVSREYKELKKEPGWALVDGLRNKVGFHYDLREFRKYDGIEGAGSEHSILVAKRFEFQSFPYGEIALVSGLGNTKGQFLQSNAQEEIKKLSEFTRQAMRRFSTVFQAFFEKFIAVHQIPSQVEKTVPRSLIAQRDQTPFPLFLIPEASQ